MASQVPATQLEGTIASPGAQQPPSQRRCPQKAAAPAGSQVPAYAGQYPLATAEEQHPAYQLGMQHQQQMLQLNQQLQWHSARSESSLGSFAGHVQNLRAPDERPNAPRARAPPPCIPTRLPLQYRQKGIRGRLCASGELDARLVRGSERYSPTCLVECCTESRGSRPVFRPPAPRSDVLRVHGANRSLRTTGRGDPQRGHIRELPPTRRRLGRGRVDRGPRRRVRPRPGRPRRPYRLRSRGVPVDARPMPLCPLPRGPPDRRRLMVDHYCTPARTRQQPARGATRRMRRTGLPPARGGSVT